MSTNYLSVNGYTEQSGNDGSVNDATSTEILNAGVNEASPLIQSASASTHYGSESAYLTQTDEQYVGSGTVLSSIFTLVSTMIGGGILSLPFAFDQGGFLITSIIFVLTLTASTHGGFLIINSKKYCQGRILNIEDVARIAFGRKGELLVQTVLIMTLFLCSIAYFILITDQLHPIFEYCLGESSYWSQRVVILTSFVLVIFPFTLLPTVTAMKYTSVLSVFCVLFLAGTVVYHSVHSDLGGPYHKVDNPVKLWPDHFGGVLTSLSIVSLAFGCHFNILPMHTELQHQTRRNKRVILYTAMILTGALNAVVSFFGYMEFRQFIAEDITQNYSKKEVIIHVGRGGLALTLILSYPLLILPCRDVINKLILNPTQLFKRTTPLSRPMRLLYNGTLSGPSKILWVLETMILVSLSYIGARFIPQVTMVWGFVGAIGNSLIIYILPPAFYLRVRRHPERPDAKKIFAFLLMTTGILCLIVTTYQSVVNVIYPIKTHIPLPHKRNETYF